MSSVISTEYLLLFSCLLTRMETVWYVIIYYVLVCSTHDVEVVSLIELLIALMKINFESRR